MKTQETVELALNKYLVELDAAEAELKRLQTNLEDLRAWGDSGRVSREPEFFIAQVKEKDDIKEQIAAIEAKLSDLHFKIKFAKWVLDEK